MSLRSGNAFISAAAVQHNAASPANIIALKRTFSLVMFAYLSWVAASFPFDDTGEGDADGITG